MGILFSLSGLDGSGKTTQGKLLYNRCKKEGINVYYIHLKTVNSFQNLSYVSSKIRKFIREHHIKNSDEIKNITSAFIFVNKVEMEITEACRKYDVTIVDRYRESAKYYHLMEGGLYSSILEIYGRIPDPDVNVFLDLRPERCYQRLIEREELTLYEKPDSLEKAYNFYKSMSKEFKWIDANRSKEIIAEELFSLIEEKLH